MKFTESLSEQGKKNWAEIYKRIKRKKWENPTLESPEEMKEIMEESPNYVIESKGRE